MLEVGVKVKDFTLKNKDGIDTKLSDLKKSKTVIFFYPKNNTIGCTKEACSFSDLRKEFDKHDIAVIGISTDSPNSHASFAYSYSLNIELLSDQDKLVSEYFGAVNHATKSKRAKRVTFILDEDLNIIYVYKKVKPATHGEDVLNRIINNDFN